MTPREPPDLERFVHRALRELPPHRAPATLENRVLAALAARERRPWWQCGWEAWPVVPRTAVFAGSAAAVAVFAWLAFTGQQAAASVSLDQLVQTHAPWLHTIRSVAGTLAGAGESLVAHHQAWFVGIFAVFAASYAMTIGLGATFYRNFVLNR